MGIEREVKLTAPEGLQLPGLGGVLDGVTSTRLPARQLSATYYDTADLLLARSGLTLRHRIGEDGPAWTVKLPATGSGAALERQEIMVDAPPGAVPERARDLVRGYVRSRPLVEVVRLDTRRQPVRLRGTDGEALAEVVDDDVTAFSTVAAPEVPRFREIEVEASSALREDAAAILEATTRRLIASGCRIENGVPKLQRALGAPARRPPEVVVPELGPRSTVGELVSGSVAWALETKIRRHDPGARLGDDPEDVHQLRVGARRLRSDLQTYAALLDPAWVVRLRAELRWLGAEAGAVRDCDVLTLRLREQAARLDEPAAIEPVLRVLEGQAAQERAEMLAALRGERYDALLDDLAAAYERPRFAAKPNGLAHRPAREFAPALVRRPWRRLRRAVRALEDAPPDTALHNVRILAKRCRYAAEAVAPVVGEDAARFARAIARIQGVLGDHQDAILAERWLLTAGAAVDRGADVEAVIQQLLAVQRAERDRLREEWPAVWRTASARSLRRWL